MQHGHVVRGCQAGQSTPGFPTAWPGERSPRGQDRRRWGGNLVGEHRTSGASALPPVPARSGPNGGDDRVRARGGRPRQLAHRCDGAAHGLSPSVARVGAAALREELSEQDGLRREPRETSEPGELGPAPKWAQVPVPRLRGQPPRHRLGHRLRDRSAAPREERDRFRDELMGPRGEALHAALGAGPPARDSVAELLAPTQFGEGGSTPCHRSATRGPMGHQTRPRARPRDAKSPGRPGPGSWSPGCPWPNPAPTEGSATRRRIGPL